MSIRYVTAYLPRRGHPHGGRHHSLSLKTGNAVLMILVAGTRGCLIADKIIVINDDHQGTRSLMYVWFWNLINVPGQGVPALRPIDRLIRRYLTVMTRLPYSQLPVVVLCTR
ncbi:hypothetical protein B0T21DRAFT_360333 [Apiosordaria backusii]|uniref:Uncharacterized protein n=1 Tax=Apiosordaria backusii TaxID=314023 RepID=A0AA40EM94_9PEZI|nr:hypothetical protein B0T21DRAFT_360333 [Apiosordaria backusii]